MPSIASAYRGPLVIIGLGSGFSVVGAVPVAITFSIGMKTSATIIGMGFVGFGFLLIIPGLFWCVMVRTHSFKFWRRKRRSNTRQEEDDEEEQTPALNCNNKTDKNMLNNAQRERRWPPLYVNSPPLIITDHCIATNYGDSVINTIVAGSAAGVAPDCSYDNEDCHSDNENAPINGNFDNATTADDVDNNNRGTFSTAATSTTTTTATATNATTTRNAAVQSVDIHCTAPVAPEIEPTAILRSV